jgi:hypothetical protein
MRRIAASVPALLLWSAVAFVCAAQERAPPAREPGDASFELLVDTFFGMTAAREEYSPRLDGIVKWRTDEAVTFLILGAPDSARRNLVHEHLARLARLSGLRFVDVSDQPIEAHSLAAPPATLLPGFRYRHENWAIRNFVEGDTIRSRLVAFHAPPTLVWWRARLIIAFGDRTSLIRLAREWFRTGTELLYRVAVGNAKCFGTFYMDGRWIDNAAVFIPISEDARLVNACIIEELTQSLGLTTDVPGSTVTRFNGVDQLDDYDMTRHDELFLRVLYHPSLEPGLAGEALRARVRPLIAEELRRDPSLAPPAAAGRTPAPAQPAR